MIILGIPEIRGSGEKMDLPRTHQAPGDEPEQARFTQDESGATLDSGAAVCRFGARKGGRLERWQWCTVPPPVAANPATKHDPPLELDLVAQKYGALIDHFIPLGTTPAQFAAGEHKEYGDFVEGEFRFQVVDSGGEIRIGLLRDGTISAGKRVAEVRMAKSAAVRPNSDDLAVLYRIINSSLRPIQILFAVELNLYAPGLTLPGNEHDGYYQIDGAKPDDAWLGSNGVSANCTHAALVNPAGEVALQLGWDRQCDLWRMPAPGGPAVRLLPVWRLQIPPRDNWALGLWLAPG
jgi:hypothetical protein